MQERSVKQVIRAAAMTLRIWEAPKKDPREAMAVRLEAVPERILEAVRVMAQAVPPEGGLETDQAVSPVEDQEVMAEDLAALEEAEMPAGDKDFSALPLRRAVLI